jgi:transcriptional regulator with XRE-family HTH domain
MFNKKITQSQKKKSKATSQTINIILDAISHGLSQREAATLAGISEDTLSLWKRDSDFSEQIRQKQIENKLRHINVINEASKKHWQASAWWLERKYKEEFSLKNKLDLETNIKLEEMTIEIKKILSPSN